MDKRTDKRPAKEAARRRIAIVCGTVTSFDAISECALACLDAAIVLPGTIDVRIYCLDTNVGNSRIHVVASIQDLIAEPFYQRADIIIHHFGIMSELHLALALAPRTAHLIVQFYGVTPAHFLTRQQQRVIGESYIQIGLFEHANEIVVNSAYLADEVRRIGITRPMRQLDLFGVNISANLPPPVVRESDAPLKVVYCGRFVRSKQVVPIIEVLDAAAPRLHAIHLSLIGVTDHSDAGYLSEIDDAIATARISVTFETNLSAKNVSSAISGADLLVLPSLHEGFGMPVAEALAAGIPVVCSDAGSLPEVAGGFALLFASGDTAALACALETALKARAAGNVSSESGTTTYTAWREQVLNFATRYRRGAFVTRWHDLLLEILSTHRMRELAPAARTDAFRTALPHQQQHHPAEAQLLGRFVALKAAGRCDINPSGAIDVLHRWAFGRPCDDSSLGYWRPFLLSGAPARISITELLRTEQVRSSSLRLRSIGGLKATLQELADADTRSVANAEGASPERLSRAEVESILSHSGSNAEFVKEAYLLILRREAEPAGLRDHLAWLNVTGDRTELIKQMFNSPEFASLA